MLSLSHTVGYATLALGCIGSWKGQRVQSTQIQECTGVSMPYLRKILFLLGKSGLIEAKRGYRGGFLLARPASEITMLDVMEALGKDHAVPDCLLELDGCSDETPCPLHSFWQEERARIHDKLGEITVAEAAVSVRAARWGKLTQCPPCPIDEIELRGNKPKRTTGQQRRKTKKPTPKRSKGRASRRKRS